MSEDREGHSEAGGHSGEEGGGGGDGGQGRYCRACGLEKMDGDFSPGPWEAVGEFGKARVWQSQIYVPLQLRTGKWRAHGTVWGRLGGGEMG